MGLWTCQTCSCLYSPAREWGRLLFPANIRIKRIPVAVFRWFLSTASGDLLNRAFSYILSDNLFLIICSVFVFFQKKCIFVQPIA